MQKFQAKSNQSAYFRISKYRREHIQDLVDEYINILAILYGNSIASGEKRISDYHSMTMQQAEHEIKLRTAVTNAQLTRKRKTLRDEHTKAENELLEQLKRIS